MAVKTLTTSGTRQALAAANATTPTLRWCNRCTIQLLTGTTVYIGLPRPLGSANTVSSTVNDIRLTAANPSFTIGPIHDGNGVDLGDTYWDSDTSGATVSIAPLTV